MSENTAYEIRNFTADDMFPMFQIISKIGIKEFKACFASEEVKNAIASVASGKENKEEQISAIGLQVTIDIASILLSNIGACKQDIYQFLAQVTGMTVKEVAALPMMTFTNMVIEVVKKEEFKDFFTAVSRLLK